jgi:hypothetical protein
MMVTSGVTTSMGTEFNFLRRQASLANNNEVLTSALPVGRTGGKGPHLGSGHVLQPANSRHHPGRESRWSCGTAQGAAGNMPVYVGKPQTAGSGWSKVPCGVEADRPGVQSEFNCNAECLRPPKTRQRVVSTKMAGWRRWPSGSSAPHSGIPSKRTD